MELSVVIPSHGGERRLPATLASLAACAPPAGGAEIILVDDGSPHPLSPGALPGAPLPIEVVRLARNRGRAAACNAGARRARGRVLLILDDDMSAPPELLRVHLGFHLPDEAPLGVIGAIEPDPAAFRGRFGRFLALEERRRHERLERRAERLSFADCLTGHFSIPRAALLDAGGYDEGFERYGFEDIELARRLDERGVRLVYRPLARVVHRSEGARFAAHCARHRESGEMAVYFAGRHGGSEVERLLRIEPGDAPGGWFHRLLGAGQRLVRGAPPWIRPVLLASARVKVRLLEFVAPPRLLHLAYHLARDLHYADGVARGLERRGARVRRPG